MRRAILSLLLLCSCLTIGAQRFYNLTAPQVRVDSVLPVVSYAIPLYDNYADSTYTVSIEYPEFIPMSDADIQHYQQITQEELPKLPKISQQIAVSRKKASLEVSFVPLVYRNKKYQKLVSFMLKGLLHLFIAHAIRFESHALGFQIDVSALYQHIYLVEGIHHHKFPLIISNY